ncbi:MAG: GTP cyclohydrolase I FolE [Caldiserica bacterium]|jgi:GTP cyclohydrolase I|nr:GTP cyclohydrolase I FolE [Caldisericota bacterium]MDH7562679.1 GTP cyclohydrolase I FolE [Caldisericota bacterium]
MVDQERIKKAIREIIEAIGEDPDREGLIRTPERVAEMYADIFSGTEEKALEELSVGFQEPHSEMVLVRDIPFYSMCEHHFLPFFGKAHVGYIPKGKIVGLSKIARVVDILSRKPQMQERLTSKVADLIEKALEPQGVGIVLEAEHMCMVMRGVKKPGSFVVTSALRGVFRSRIETRSEFFSLVFSSRNR